MHITQSLGRRFAVVGLAATATVIVVTGVAASGPLGEVLTALGIIDDNVDSLVATQAEQSSQLQALGSALTEVAADADEVRVEVVVHEAACASIASACSALDMANVATGHTYQAASSSNHNPVQVGFLVTRNGQAVNTLTAADVTIQFRFVPANGPTPDLCNTTEGKCGFVNSFGTGFFSSYGIWLDVISNWAPGEYTFIVRVHDNGEHGYGMGTIEIVQ